MFKKSLVAAAALATFSAGAMAANVEIYGVLDIGFSYTHTSHQEKSDKFEMSNNLYAGSRFGFRGTEDLGDDLKVGFILENGFVPDTGAMAADDTIFNRESQLYLKGSWGQLGFGRVGAFTSGSSSLSWYWDLEPFETGYIDAGVQASQVNVWRLNSNTVYYISPVFAGFKFGAQYSFTGEDPQTQEAECFSDNNTFANVALRWDGANARAIFGVEWEKFGAAAYDDAKEPTKVADRDDAWSVKLVGAWVPNGGPVTLYAGANWYKNSDQFADSTYDDEGWSKIGFDRDSGKRLDGYSFFVGGKYTVGAANWLAMFQYLDGENKGAVDGATDTDYKRYIGSVGCHYYLSKRTMLYTIASYADGDGLFDNLNSETSTDRFMAHVGITHFF